MKLVHACITNSYFYASRAFSLKVSTVCTKQNYFKSLIVDTVKKKNIQLGISYTKKLSETKQVLMINNAQFSWSYNVVKIMP